jgi:hypothetical protein
MALPAEFVGRPKITDRQDVMLDAGRSRSCGCESVGTRSPRSVSFHGITRSLTGFGSCTVEVPEHVRNRSIEVLDHADVG